MQKSSWVPRCLWKKKGCVLSDKLLWNVLPSLKMWYSKAIQKDDDKDKNNISVAGTEWDDIGILSDLFDSNDNIDTNINITIDKSIDTIGVDAAIDAEALINNDLDEDGGNNEITIVNDNMTIGLAGYCSRTVTIKKYLFFRKYKGDCHSYASDLLKKKNILIQGCTHSNETGEKEEY